VVGRWVSARNTLELCVPTGYDFLSNPPSMYQAPTCSRLRTHAHAHAPPNCAWWSRSASTRCLLCSSSLALPSLTLAHTHIAQPSGLMHPSRKTIIVCWLFGGCSQSARTRTAAASRRAHRAQPRPTRLCTSPLLFLCARALVLTFLFGSFCDWSHAATPCGCDISPPRSS
jgi:hypothetical protein